MQAPTPSCTEPGLLMAKPSKANVQMPRLPCGPGPATVPHSSCPTSFQRQRSNFTPFVATIFSQVLAPARVHLSKLAELHRLEVWVMHAPFSSHTGHPVL